MKIIIDNEFKNLIPPLTKEERKELVESIKKEGCREPINTWNNIIVDGHNRYEICEKNNISFKTKPIKFKDRDEAIIWMVTNQLARRNISPYDRTILAIIKCERQLKDKAEEKQFKGGKKKVSQKSAKPIDVRKEIAKVAGISHDTVSKVKYIEKNATKEEKEELHNPKSSINKVYTNNKKKKEREDIENNFKKPEPLPKDKKYNIIYADPPWKFWGGGWKNQAQHYTIMKMEDVIKLPINDLAAKDCILFLWATYPILPEAFEVIKAWGFKYATVGFTWVKTTKNNKWHFGLGYWTRANPELCLIATKGKPTRKSASIPNLIISQVEGHSKKPDIVRDKIVELMGDIPRIELFAREKTKGWDVWGNEIKEDKNEKGEMS